MTHPLRLHGTTPYRTVVLHGGPGAIGEMYTVAEELSRTQGVLEPLLSAYTIEGQLHELSEVLQTYGTEPYMLIGHSWGAWLAYLFTARHPSLVRKLILISSGPFEDRYADTVAKTRLKRLGTDGRHRLHELQQQLNQPDETHRNTIFRDIGQLLTTVDSIDLLPYDESKMVFRYDVFTSIWNEAEQWRKTGKLLREGQDIRCPVIAIHGDSDPHPPSGVSKPLAKILPNFRLILLKNCGHYPWLERKTQKAFYHTLTETLV